MTTITTRAGKGTPLTNNELDANFINLNAEVTPSRPTIRPSLSLDFANSKSVDSRITFTRASSATRYDANGVLQKVVNDQPRIDFDPSTGECKGLLVEEQRTNSVYYSDQLRVGGATYNSRVYDKAAIAPDGSMSAIRLTDDGTLNEHCLNNTYFSSIVQGTTYTISAYMKADGSGGKGVLRYFGNEWVNAVYNLSTGTVDYNAIQTGAFSSGMTPVGNGWYRCWFTHTATGNYNTVVTQACVANSSNSFYFSGTGALGVYVWGYQFEVASFPTSYIPSTTAFTSRASSATYFDSTGTLRYAGVNQPRYGYGYDTTSGTWKSQGLVLEAAATNLVVSSGVPAGVYQSVNTFNATTAPDGSQTAWLNTPNNGTAIGNSTCVLASFGSSPATGTYCYSVYMKPNGMTRVRLYDNANSTNVYINLTGAGSYDTLYGLAAGVTQLANGWYRAWLVGTHTNGGLPYFQVYSGAAGDGVIGVYYWGIQIETGYAPTSYIPTYGATATRAADVSSSAQTTRAQDDPSAILFSTAGVTPDNFTVCADYNGLTRSGGYQQLIGFGDAYYNNTSYCGFYWGQSASSTSVLGINRDVLGPAESNYFSTSNPRKVATGFQKGVGWFLSVDSASINIPDTSANLPKVGVDRIYLLTSVGSFLNRMPLGWIKSYKVYPKRLSNTEIQALTA